MGTDTQPSPEQIAQHVQQSLPAGGLFAGHQWRVATQPFPLDKKTVQQLEQLGRVLLKFYQAANTIYRWSAEGRLPAWPSAWEPLSPWLITPTIKSKLFFSGCFAARSYPSNNAAMVWDAMEVEGPSPPRKSRPHTVPHSPLWYTSSRPSPGEEPSAKRTCSWGRG